MLRTLQCGSIPTRLLSSLHQKTFLSKVTNDFCTARSNGKFCIFILLIRLFNRKDHSLFPETISSVVSRTPLTPGVVLLLHWLLLPVSGLILPFSMSCCMPLLLSDICQKTESLFSTKGETGDLWTGDQPAQLTGCISDHKQWILVIS